jgi:hypothetical protein
MICYKARTRLRDDREVFSCRALRIYELVAEMPIEIGEKKQATCLADAALGRLLPSEASPWLKPPFLLHRQLALSIHALKFVG